MIDATDIIGGLVSALLLVIGYFLKVLHKDVKENIERTSSNSADIKLLQQKSDDKIDRLAEITELQIQSVTKAVETLNKTVSHMNGNMKNKDNYYALKLEMLEKKR